MKKIIYITEQFPYPADSGGKIKTLNTLNTLAQKYQVHLISFSPEPIKQKYKKFVQSKLSSSTLFVDPDINLSVKKQLNKLVKNYLQGIPYLVFQYQNQTIYSQIQNLINKVQPDLIHIDHLDMAQYLPKDKFCPWILEEHNLESSLLFSRFIYHKHFKTKLLLLAETILTKIYEQRILPKFDAIITISHRDESIIKSKLNNSLVFPYPVPIRKLKLNKRPKTGNLLFIGDLTWHPNRDAVIWFINEIFPLVKNKFEKVNLDLVGKYNPELKRHETKSIQFHGYQRKIKPYLEKANVFILPFRIGEGVRIKALTALSAGIPIVSTSTGVKGLTLEPDRGFLLANQKKRFAQRIIEVITSPKLKDRLQEDGYDFLKKYHSEKNNLEFLKRYDRLF